MHLRSSSKSRFLEALESRQLLSSSPIGYLDSTANNQLAGWAADPDAPTAAVSIQLQIDGQVQSPVYQADHERPDLISYAPVGSAFHGFNITIPTLSAGLHQIQVYALDSGSDQRTLLGQTVQGQATVTGYLDTADMSRISGWAADTAQKTAAVSIQVEIDGQIVKDALVAQETRPDLVSYAPIGNAKHGFSIDTSTLGANLGVGEHTIKVWALDLNSHLPTLLGQGQRTLVNHAPIGYLDQASGFQLSGWVHDPDLKTNAATLEIWIDGAKATSLQADQSRADLTAYTPVGSPNHGFSFLTPSISWGTHKIELFAVDNLSKALTLLGTTTVTNHAPTGWVDVIDKTHVSGWAFDSDVTSNSIHVRIDIDGLEGAPFRASVARADLTGYLPVGSPNHGFSFRLPTSLSAGNHTIEVWVYDPNNLQTLKLGSAVITI